MPVSKFGDQRTHLFLFLCFSVGIALLFIEFAVVNTLECSPYSQCPPLPPNWLYHIPFYKEFVISDFAAAYAQSAWYAVNVEPIFGPEIEWSLTAIDKLPVYFDGSCILCRHSLASLTSLSNPGAWYFNKYIPQCRTARMVDSLPP